MEKRKAAWWLAFLGILLMLSVIILGEALVAQCSRLNGGYAMQKVVVSVKNQIDPQGINAFSIEDIKRLKKELSTETLSYTVQSELMDTSVTHGTATLPVTLMGTDYRYPQFNSLVLIEGSFITQKQEEEGMMVAVIDEELAWHLFKTVHVTGKTLDIFGGVFRIIGVVKKNDTFIGKLTDDGLPKVYIPGQIMLERSPAARITALQIKTANSDTMDQNTEAISTALRQIGKAPSNYKISDYNLRFALIEQKPRLFIFILGLASIFILTAHLKNLIKMLYAFIKKRCKTDYFLNVIKCNLKEIGINTLEIVLVFVGMLLIWLGIRFRLYIPPQHIADELIDISYYLELIKNFIQDGIQNRGYIAPQTELIMSTITMLLSLIFYICTILGFLFMYTGFRELRTLNRDANRLILILSLFFMFSLGILAATAFLLGLPFILDIRGIWVAWVFVFLNTLHTIKKEERGIGND